MAGSTYGTVFRITTWGESHGKALGVVVDGCPAGLELEERDIREILADVLFQFPVREVALELPGWICALSPDHWLKSALYDAIRDCGKDIGCIGQLKDKIISLQECEYVDRMDLDSIDLGSGSAKARLTAKNNLFYQILGEETGLDIPDESALLPCMVELAAMKKEYDKVNQFRNENAHV